MLKRIRKFLREEFGAVNPRFVLARMALFFLPVPGCGRIRSMILRALGFKIGKGSLFLSTPRMVGPRHAHKNIIVGREVMINVGVHLDAAAPITIGDQAYFGHNVTIMTTSHDLNDHNFELGMSRAGASAIAPTTIGQGVWLGAGVSVLPGVTIGAGVVVAAGAVVTKDLEPHTLYGGIPAKPIRKLGLKEEVDLGDIAQQIA